MVRLRVARIGASVARLRVARIAVAGTSIAQITVTASATVSAFETITWTATVTQGTPDEYLWDQVSGPTTESTGSGTTRTMVAPADLDGVTIVMGCRAVTGGLLGPVVTSTVIVRPHLSWVRVGGAWVAMSVPRIGGSPAWVALDTDGVPYYGTGVVPEGVTTGWICLDTDGVPYYSETSTGAVRTRVDTDGVPLIA